MLQPKIETIKAADGTPIITASFTPHKPIGVIQIVHGFGEHHAGYHITARYFCEKGFACMLFDQRGHGENHRNRQGILSDYNLFLDDIKTVREKIEKDFPGLPVYLYGHSMGGNISVNYILRRGGKEFSKLVLETPWLRLKTPMPKPIVALALLLGRLSHRPAATSKLVYEAITRDAEGIERIRNDKLYHNRLSMRIFTQITKAGEYAIENAKNLSIPTLLLCADADQIVSPDAIKEFAQASNKNVELYAEPEGYHALHSDSEPTRTRVLEKVEGFLKGKE